jgi:hypothetical protein
MTSSPPQTDRVRRLRSLHVADVSLTRVYVRDQYDRKKYRVERRLVRAFLNFVEDYLKRRPELEFEHRTNVTRLLIYLPPAMKAWREYVPGGVATFHVHAPHNRRLPNGHKLDVITRGFFRHSVDAVGLRSRAAILAMIAREHIDEWDGEVKWLSVAGGSGQPVYDVCEQLSEPDRARLSLTLVDLDSFMVGFAKRLYETAPFQLKSAVFQTRNITHVPSRREILQSVQPDFIDCMGLFEYLEDKQAVALIKALVAALPKGGSLVFTNMSPGHPLLNVHQRALGWPGVIQRTIHEVAELFDAAGINRKNTEVYRAEDNVYNVYRVKK